MDQTTPKKTARKVGARTTTKAARRVLMLTISIIAVAAIAGGALVNPASSQVADPSGSAGKYVPQEASQLAPEEELPLLDATIPNQMNPNGLVKVVANQRAIAEVTHNGGQDSLTMLQQICLAEPFDFTIWLGDRTETQVPDSAYLTVETTGTDLTLPGKILVIDEPSSPIRAGLTSVEFSFVAYDPGASYSVEIDHGTPMAFDPFCSDPTEALPLWSVADRGTAKEADLATQAGCGTLVVFSKGKGEGFVTAYTPGNNWRPFVGANFPVSTGFSSVQCNTQANGGVAGGFGLAIYGHNEPPIGGSQNFEIAMSFRGGEQTTSYPGGYASLTIRPAVVLFKPDGNRIRLESGAILGKNKVDCTNWPDTLGTAFSYIPTKYAWSVIGTTFLRSYCWTVWRELATGPAGNRDYAGFWQEEGAFTGQQDVGGRVVYKANSPGVYTMPVWIGLNGSGKGRADGAPSTSYSRWDSGTIAYPQAKVV